MTEPTRTDHIWFMADGRAAHVSVATQAKWGNWIKYVCKHGPLPGAVEGPRPQDTGDPPPTVRSYP
jgi:hypothetical protein